MGRTIELSDEQYRTIEQVAASRGQTPAVLLAELVERLRDDRSEPRYYETEDWFRHLGATDGQIAGAKRIAKARSKARDADP